MNDLKTNDFLEKEKTGKLMMKYALPCIISLLVGALYSIVDQIFIANAEYLGSVGNAANSVVFPMTVIALAVATMIGDGCSAYASISLGAGRKDDASRAVGNAITLTVASALVLTAVYFIFSKQLLLAFGAGVTEETFALSKEYFLWIAAGLPFYMFGQALNPLIRFDGSPRYAMASLLAGAIANVILDPVFIYGFHLGMTGAAVATVIGQIISAVLALIYLFRMKSVKLGRREFSLRRKTVFSFLPLGITSFLSQIAVVLSMAAVLNMCRIYGAKDEIFGRPEYAQIPTAVVGIVMKFYQIVISISIGLSAGCIPVVGYNVGAGRADRVKKLMIQLYLAEAAVGLVATVIFELFPMFFVSMFGAKKESVYYTEFAVRCIRLFLATLSISCVNKGAVIYLQAVGKAFASSALSLLREVGFGVGLAVLLPVLFGLDGLLYFMIASDVLAFFAVLAVTIKTSRTLSVSSAQKQTQN